MMLKLIIHSFIFSIIFLCFDTTIFAAPPDLAKTLPGRLRAGYMAESNIKLLDKMSQQGMNAAFPKFGSLSLPLSNEQTKSLQKFAAECSRQNLAFMPVFNWWDSEKASNFSNYNHAVTEDGIVLKNTPCPFSADFWERFITPRFVDIIRAVAGQSLQAVLIDLEMYGVDIVHYDKGCYCDSCFARYMKVKGRSGEIPAADERSSVIQNAGELKDYQAVQLQAANTLAAACRATIHKNRPDVRLGALHLDRANSLAQGIALGFGTPQLPVLCLTEETYSKGYTPYIASTQKSFRDMGAFVDLLVGIWQSRFPPENFTEQLYYSAHDSYGYWIYTMETFEKADYSPLLESSDNYWKAIQQANHELDRLEVNPSFLTALSVSSFVPPPDLLPWGEFKKFAFVPMYDARPWVMPVVRLRDLNSVHFYAKRGDKIEFELTWRQAGKYIEPVRVGLISPSGLHLDEGTVIDGQPFIAKTIATETGVYGMVVVHQGERANMVDITKASHPYATYIASSRGAQFRNVIPPLFVAVDQSANTVVEFEFRTERISEAVQGKVLAENGAELWSGVVNGPIKVRIDRPDSAYVEIRFKQLLGRRLDDVFVRGIRGVLPFVATDPAGLLSHKEQLFSPQDLRVKHNKTMQ